MELLTREEFSDLMETRQGPCVSIYIPTYRAGKEVGQGPIRLKNALRQVQEQLAALGLRSGEADDLLQPAQDLLADGDFWRHQADGLALFLAPGFVRHYRLPLTFDESLLVNERFHVKPLLPLLTGEDRFYILALSQNAVRLIQGTRYKAQPMELVDVPQSLAELKYEWDTDLNQWRAFPREAGGRAGAMSMGAGAFPGHGTVGDPDLHKQEIRQFFLQLDRGLREILREEKAPLVLAAVEYLVPIYQEVNSYPNLLSDAVRGNPELLSPEQLHQKAWDLVEGEFRKEVEQAAELYRNLMSSGRTSDNLQDIIPAAAQGRVDCLFIVLDIRMWGSYDAEAVEVQMHLDRQPGSQDLLDLAAYHTLANSGRVFAVEPENMPDATPAAAILRY